METKTVIVTGANSGLGFACAQNIAGTSPEYTIILACRNMEKAEQAKDKIITHTGNKNIILMELDLSSLASVREFTQSVISSQLTPVYGIVCNAGVGGMNSGKTKDGFELMFGVNHLGHFLLTNLLLPYISEPARIVVVSSDMHNPPGMELTWPGVNKVAYSDEAGSRQYALSKLCNLYFTYELDRRLKQAGRNITVNAFNPGLMTDTNLFSDKSVFTESFLKTVSDRMGWLEHSSEQLAGMITDPRYDNVTGKYIDRGTITESSPLSHSRVNAEELWNASEDFAG